MQINIGDRELISMNEKELFAFLHHAGIFNFELPVYLQKSIHKLRFWSDPEIKLFDRCEKDNIIYFDAETTKLENGTKHPLKGHVSFDEYYIYIEEHVKSRNFTIDNINYLIKQGFRVKLESYNND
nr:hypothetical protein [uncultured Carboxylicivirga sp.]